MRGPIVWFGHLSDPRRLKRRGWAMVGGGLGWLLLLFMLPSLGLVAVAFAQRGDYGAIDWTLTLENFRRAAGAGVLQWTSDNLLILWRSALVALATTVACVALAFPLAFFIADAPPRLRYLWLGLVVVPFCTNLVVRTYAWRLALSPTLLTGRVFHQGIAAWNALTPSWLELTPEAAAVGLGMVSAFLPFTVLPLYTSVERMDWSIVEAARDLYAQRWRTFWHGVLPQVAPGLTVAVVLTFVPAMGMFVVPRMLGGAKFMLVGDLIQQQFNESRDYPFGAALSLVLMALTLLGLWLLWRRRAGGSLL